MNLLPLRKLLIQIILLIAAIASRNFIVNQYAIYGQLLGLMPYVVLSITMMICAHYNRSRLFTASLALLICYILIQSQLQTSLSTPGNLIIFSSISLLMPATLLLLLLVPERGLFNLYGIFVIAVIPIQILAILAIISFLPQEQYVSADSTLKCNVDVKKGFM